MQPNVGNVVKRFGLPMTLVSQSAETFVKGRKVAGTTTSTAIRGVYQPTSGQDLLLLPEADRVKEVLTIWTTADVKAAYSTPGTPGDVFEFNYYRYKALILYPRKGNGFNKVIAERLND